MSCSLRPWLEGESPPGSGQSLPCPPRPPSGPPGLGLVPGGQAPGARPRPPTPLPPLRGLPAAPEAPGSTACEPRRHPGPLTAAPAASLLVGRVTCAAAGPAGDRAAGVPAVPPQARARSPHPHALARAGTGRDADGDRGRGSSPSAGPFRGTRPGSLPRAQPLLASLRVGPAPFPAAGAHSPAMLRAPRTPLPLSPWRRSLAPQLTPSMGDGARQLGNVRGGGAQSPGTQLLIRATGFY